MKRKGIEKAHEITDAKIQFVSLVDKAANKHAFLITKEENGQAAFATYGRIVKLDTEKHYVTGIVYEPMTEDSQGEYMTEEEITKAAYSFAKNGEKIDVQHNYEQLEGATVVESWVEKADTEIEGEPIKKGTWLMTVEISDGEVWDSIVKGDITGFSMGGVGFHSEEDTDLSEVTKEENESSEKKGLLTKVAEALGIKLVEKGEVAELYTERTFEDQFWEAFYALEDVLNPYDREQGDWVFESDPKKIKAALSDFNSIITDILTAGEPVIKSLMDNRPVEKAGKTMSEQNQKALEGIYEELGNVLKACGGAQEPEGEEPDVNNIAKEDTEMKRDEVEQIVNEALEKALSKQPEAEVEKAEEKAPEEITKESIEKMVQEAVEKAMAPKEEQVTVEQVEDIVTKAVEEAVEPLKKSAGVPSNLNGENVEKAEKKEHYLHGIL